MRSTRGSRGVSSIHTEEIIMTRKPKNIGTPQARKLIVEWIKALESPFGDKAAVLASMRDTKDRMYRKGTGEKRPVDIETKTAGMIEGLGPKPNGVGSASPVVPEIVAGE